MISLPLRLRLLTASVCLVMGYFQNAQAATPQIEEREVFIIDDLDERYDFMNEVRKNFFEGDFARLEQQAEELRKTNPRAICGISRQCDFYMALKPSWTVTDFTSCFAQIEKWKALSPGSPTARIAEGSILVAYAWNAHGNEKLDTMTEQARELFGQRLKEARNALDAIPEAKSSVGYFQNMLLVALGQGWSRESYDALYAQALALDPSYEFFYMCKANYLREKWYGTSGEWLRFALESAKATESKLGMSLYARIVWYEVPATREGIYLFKSDQVDWSILKRGFEDLERLAPGSLRNKNAFCLYACLAKDQPTAARLFEEIGDRDATYIWRSKQYFQNWKATMLKVKRP